MDQEMQNEIKILSDARKELVRQGIVLKSQNETAEKKLTETIQAVSDSIKRREEIDSEIEFKKKYIFDLLADVEARIRSQQ